MKKLESNIMEVRTRDDGEEFTCFTDTAPEELRNIFLGNFSIKNRDYEIFSKACDTIENAQSDNKDTDIEEYIENNYNDFASIWNDERLRYIDIHNEEEILDIIKEYECDNINVACAIWYDRQVEKAIHLIISEYLTNSR